MQTEDGPIKILASVPAARIIARELNRRRFLGFAAAAGGAAFLAACSSPESTLSNGLESQLSMYSWGDYDAPEVLTAFTKDLGPKLTVDSFGSNEELISKLVGTKGTSGYDIVVPTGPYIPQMVENNLLMKLDHSQIPNLKYMDPAFLGRDWDPTNTYSICKAWGTTGFVYDKTVINRDLYTWNDFFDAAMNEASGSVSILDDPGEITGMFYWANGIDWNTTKKEDIDAAEDFLVNKLAPHVAAFNSYPGSDAVPQDLQALIQIWNGDARLGISESDDPDKWVWRLGSPTTELWMDNWSIAEGAPHPKAAHAFINYVLEPANSLAELDYIGYHTGAIDIEQKAKDEGLERLDMVFFTPDQIATMKDAEVNEAQERTVDIWNKMKAAAGA